ncbi:hypothetical protein RN22_12435 [Grimontia sp. AD028]|uniref:Lipoprotein n=1 Tax=Grimontia sedimenti TaxID=2711294 RepID=A0A6M1RM18_9GAMM|nr:MULTISPECIES: hypothetical protein [Grimontia]KKD60125.1 hypothetical protein RN22_12435 [Grimontia sp. AD028]NGN97117.1 hypothetical protein [Grimontia sedimenti]
MKYSLITLALAGLLTACGGGGGGDTAPSGSGSTSSTDSSTTGSDTTSSGTSNTTPLGMMTDTSGADVTIPPTVLSSATNMSEMVVPADFSYDSVDSQSVDIDISSYTTSKGYISIYGGFTQNDDGSYSADYNSRITSADVENGLASLTYPLADSQYYMLAEVFFYDGTTPIQTRINNEQSSWVW